MLTPKERSLLVFLRQAIGSAPSKKDLLLKIAKKRKGSCEYERVIKEF